jgi:hypothetical protein
VLAQKPGGSFTLPAAPAPSASVRPASHAEPLPESETIHAMPGAWHPGYEEELPPTPLELDWLHRFKRALSPHSHPDDPERHFGLGDPLTGTSWRNRPLYVSLFAGGLIGDELQTGVVEQGGGAIVGGRFGGDFDHYWGVETRLAFADLHVNYPGNFGSGKSSNSYFDASLLHYPWGDSRWRPYLAVGLGVAGYQYEELSGQQIRTSAVTIPWGAGLKYLLGRRTAVRFDLTDNFSLPSASNAAAMHNFSFTGGVEIHFGGRETRYGW